MTRKLITPLLIMMLILSGCSNTSTKSNENDKASITPEVSQTEEAASEDTTADRADDVESEEEQQLPDVAIEWQDEMFEAAIRELIGKSDGDIMTSEVNQIEQIDCSNSKITSLYDLIYFVNLKEADFSHNAIGHFGDYWGIELSNLVKLNLSNNILKGISCSELPNLQYLNLQNNRIQGDLSGLTSNTKLNYLNLNNAAGTTGGSLAFHDISALSGMTELTQLDLGYTPDMIDYSCLSSLTKLQELNLENSHIFDTDLFHIEGFKELTKLNIINENTNLYDSLHSDSLGLLANLKSLSVTGNQVTLDVLGKLVNLEELYLEYGSTLDLTFLQNMKGLKKLTIIGAEIEDPTPLTKLSNLTYLDLSQSRVNGTEYLNKMTQLEELYFEPATLSYISVSDTLPVDISGLTNLRHLCYIDDINFDFNLSQLAGMKNLQVLELDIIDNETIGLEQLRKYPQITDLTISAYRGLDSLDFISDLSQLTRLRLSINDSKTDDFTPLKALINLTELQIMDSEYGTSNVTKAIPKMTKLKSLKLRTSIKQLDFLKGLKELEDLTLANANTTSVNPEILTELPNLQNLDVCDIKIDDISILANSNSLLTLTYTTRWDMEPGNLEALEEALPYLRIEEK